MSEPDVARPDRATAIKAVGEKLSCDLLYSEKTHFAASERLRRTHVCLGLLSAAASAAAAATVFTDLRVVAGAFALISSVGAALLTFLKSDKEAERHLTIGKGLGALRNEVDRIFALDLGWVKDQVVRDAIEDLSSRKAEIDATAPGTNERDFKAASAKIKRGDFEVD